MGKFDKSRLSGLKSLSTTTSSAAIETTKSDDLRLKLLKKNQVLDARQLINKKKQQQKQQISLNKKQIIDDNNDNSLINASKGGSLLIMKTIDADTGSEKRLYKVINNYNEINEKKHIVFANDNNTLITLKNDQNIRAKNNNENLFKKTIKTHLNIDDEEDEALEDDDDDHDNGNDIDYFPIKRTFNNNENFKIKINNDEPIINNNTSNTQIKRIGSGSGNSQINKINNNNDAMEIDNDTDKNDVHSPIQGYRLLVSNLHPNVTEDDILELFSAIGPIKRAKFLSKGNADVVYVKSEDARNAISNYNNKLLDGRELKIELLTKLPICEKLTVTSNQPTQINFNQQQQQNTTKSSQQTNQLITQTQTALPQRVRQTTANQSLTPSIISSTNNNDIVSKRFNVNVNTQSIQDQQKQLNKPILTTTSATPVPTSTQTTNNQTSKVAVDTSIIHQALFTNTKTNPNPVTFTVKI